MHVHALMYHDVVPAGAWDSSGFRGAHADHYKLDVAAFERHLESVARVLSHPPTTVDRLLEAAEADQAAVLLTFDDGGGSAFREIAPRLEARGWRGHFFITTDRIGEPGFLSAEQIRELHTRGHLIGSHTCSHPPRVGGLPYERLVREWRQSRVRLEEILQQPVTIASIPGGHYTVSVARAAAECGYACLMTSEPSSRPWEIAGCRLLGRYAITRRTSALGAAKLASGAATARGRAWLAWNLRKAAKRLSGPWYEPVRRALLRLVSLPPAGKDQRPIASEKPL